MQGVFSLLLFNFTLLVTCSYLGSLLLRSWPVRSTWPLVSLASLCGVASGLTLMQYPIPVSPGILADLRNVPVALLTLRFGPGVGLLTAAPLMGYRMLLGGIGVWVALASTLSIILLSSVARRRSIGRPALLWRWWVPFALFCLNGLPLLFVPGGVHDLKRVYVIVNFANGVGLTICMGMLRQRLRLLKLADTHLKQAHTDALTRLHNRRRYDLDKTRLGAHDRLLMIDLDHFKQINDQHGHAVGDEVLRALAALLRQGARPGDGAYRIGGEEFVLILRGVTPAQARETAERLRQAVLRHRWPFDAQVTVSLGLESDAGGSPAERLASADRALYAAKHAGRNRVWQDAAL